MKLASYIHNNSVSCGIVTDSGILDIPSNTEFHSMRQILTKGDSALEILSHLSETGQMWIPLTDVELLPPIPKPGKILALAGNYKKHLEESVWQEKTFDDQSVTTNPWPFMMPSTVLTAAGTEIPWPVYSEQVDYEIELAVIIGKTTNKVTPEEAANCIGGYSIANDISARSVTFTDGRKDRPRDAYFDWLMGKWSDGFMPMGPWMVTADEIGDPQKLELELKVNGQIRQKSNTSQMIFSVGQIVSFMSHLMTLEPGDVIITGTPHGVGMADGNYLRPGDAMEGAIEKIGTLTNTLGPKPNVFYNAFLKS